jgi:hypothetical protein
LISDKDKPALLIISLSSGINPIGECVLSLCEAVNAQKINTPFNISLSGSACENKYFDGKEPIKEAEVFDEI